MAIFSHVPNTEHEHLRRNEHILLHQTTKNGFKLLRAYILHVLIKAKKRIQYNNIRSLHERGKGSGTD